MLIHDSDSQITGSPISVMTETMKLQNKVYEKLFQKLLDQQKLLLQQKHLQKWKMMTVKMLQLCVFLQ